MSGVTVRLAAMVLALVAAEAAYGAKMLMAGAGEVDISPRKLPIIVSGGFLARTVKESSGPLRARALVLDDGSRRIVIAVADSLMMPRELLDEVKQAASRATGIPPERMLISATHTHSAPPVMGALGTDENPAYTALMRAQLIRAIEIAAGRLRPARIGWAVIPVPEMTHCRRWILRPDKIRKDPFGEATVRANMHPGYQNPEFIGPSGPTDPDLTVVAVQSPDGKPIALLANYSMHYVGGDRGVSPDYFGPFCDNVRRLLGVAQDDAGFIAMMSQGTSGDQHWMDYSRPKQEVATGPYAEALARKAHQAYRSIRFRDWVPLDMRETRLTLNRRVPDERRLAWARELFAGVPDGIPRNQVEVYAREQILLAAQPRRELMLQAIRIGELGIAAWPNEVFALSGLKLKAQSPLQPAFNIELANGAEGYIPPPEQHRLGGYTTWPARTAGLEPAAEPRIVEALLSLLEQLAGRKRRTPALLSEEYAKAVLAARPVAYWRGHEMGGDAALDSSGNRRPGKYVGGVAFYLDGPGLQGRAPHYAGGQMSAGVRIRGGRYSIAMWFYNGLPAGVRNVAGILYSYGADQLSLGEKLQFEAGGRRLEGKTSLARNTWYFVAVNRDGPEARIFLNGEAECAGSLAPAGQAGEFRLAAGGDRDASLEGRIAEAALFDRPLKPDQIAAFYRRMVSTPRSSN